VVLVGDGERLFAVDAGSGQPHHRAGGEAIAGQVQGRRGADRRLHRVERGDERVHRGAAADAGGAAAARRADAVTEAAVVVARGDVDAGASAEREARAAVAARAAALA